MNHEANTPLGHGLSVRVAKVAAQLTALHMALKNEWPMPWEFFRNTVRETREHTEGVLTPDWITPDTYVEITSWAGYIEDLRVAVGNEADHTNDTPVTVYGESYLNTLHDLIIKSWQLLAVLDREMLGIETADAGRVL